MQLFRFGILFAACAAISGVSFASMGDPQDEEITPEVELRFTVKPHVSLADQCASEAAELADVEKALALCNAAIEENPDDAGSYYYRGNVHFSLGDYASAEADFTEAIRLQTNYMARTYYQRGVARENLGRFKQACLEDYKMALELEPGWGFAKRAVESCAWAYE